MRQKPAPVLALRLGSNYQGLSLGDTVREATSLMSQ